VGELVNYLTVRLILNVGITIWAFLPREVTKRQFIDFPTFVVWWVLWVAAILVMTSPIGGLIKDVVGYGVILYLSYRDDDPTKKGRWKKLILGELTKIQEMVMQRQTREVLG